MHISNKCSIAVHCLIFIFEYGTEKKVTSELLSLSTGCNPVTIRNILSALKKDGIIEVNQEPEEPPLRFHFPKFRCIGSAML